MATGSAGIAAMATLLLVCACAQTPHPTTLSAYVEAQFARAEQIRRCNPDQVVCSRLRDREPHEQACLPPQYPLASIKAEEDGVSEVALQLAEDGAVVQALLVKSSGHPRLDAATVDGFSKCRFPADLVRQLGGDRRHVIHYRWDLQGEAAYQARSNTFFRDERTGRRPDLYRRGPAGL
jgi:TonB family protein